MADGDDTKRALADALNRVASEMQTLRDLLTPSPSRSQDDVKQTLEGIKTSLDQINEEIKNLSDDEQDDRPGWWGWMRRNRRRAGAGAVLTAVLLAAAIYFAVPLLLPPELTADEQACADQIQGQIAWNDDGNTRWDQRWLKSLCQGVTKPTQPGLCFSTIRKIPLQRGAAIQADWKDAVALCTGADNAQERIFCYRKKTEDGAYFRDAIETCNDRPPEVTARTACQRLVQGNISVNRVAPTDEDEEDGREEDGQQDEKRKIEGRDTVWRQSQLELLCGETTQPTQLLLCFDRLFHGRGPWNSIIDDQWHRAAELCSGTESVQRTTQCVISQLEELDGEDSGPGPLITNSGETPTRQDSSTEPLFKAVLQACNPRDTDNSIAQCKRYVQRDIPWSEEGYTEWQPAVLSKLCGQTRAYQQPGQCFLRAMNGRIDAAGTGLSKWAYAVQLCAGTNSAEARLQCYQRQRDAGRDNRAAIQACQNFAED